MEQKKELKPYAISSVSTKDKFIGLPKNLKELPRKLALLCLEIEKTCIDYTGVLKGKRFLLAVSGGADSTAMAVIFSLLSRKNNFDIEIAHINHNLRPESTQELIFVQELAQRLKIQFHAFNLPIKDMAKKYNMGLEEAGRKGRQEALSTLREKIHADYILTAHHAGDLAEDILMRLTRGTGWPALGGMAILNNYWFRPFLHTLPDDLRQFLITIGQNWCEDSSNKDMSFTRNRFRHEILPLFLRENREYIRNLIELNMQAQTDAAYWNDKINNCLSALPWKEKIRDGSMEIFLPKNLLDQLACAERTRVYMKVFKRMKEISGQPVHARSRTILKLEKHLCLEKRGIFQFPGKLLVKTLKHGVLFTVPIKSATK